MKQNKCIIDITENIKNRDSIIVISGRNLGKEQRKSLKIDEKINKYEIIEVVIPNNIYSISSSFFLGMFGDIVRNYKTKEKFLEKFIFNCSESLKNNINDGINDALNDVDAME